MVVCCHCINTSFVRITPYEIKTKVLKSYTKKVRMENGAAWCGVMGGGGGGGKGAFKVVKLGSLLETNMRERLFRHATPRVTALRAPVVSSFPGRTPALRQVATSG